MTLTQKSDSKFLLFGDKFVHSSDEDLSLLHLPKFYFTPMIWSDRLVLFSDKNNQNDDKFWNFIAFDLLTKESRQIRFRKTLSHLPTSAFYSLNFDTGIIIESLENLHRINVVKIDWHTGEFQLIEYFEKKCNVCWISVDKMEPSKFVVCLNRRDWSKIYRPCKLINGKIEFGESIRFINALYPYYHSDKIFDVWTDRILLCDFILKKRQTFKIDKSALPEKFSLTENCEFVNDRIYACVKFGDTNCYGIIWTNLIIKSWAPVNFKTTLMPDELHFCNGGLIMRTHWKVGQEKIETKFYGIPMRRPNYLRYSAWLLVVKIMKNIGEKDPYKAAKEFLPLNSDLREQWFKDEENS